VPVVSLPPATSVLQLAKGQAEAMGVAELLVATDVKDYVARAVHIATGERSCGGLSR
jgi:hypothetical protein